MDSKICVLGLGYIGLPTASILAVNGFWVTGVDTNPDVVDIVNQGGVHIYEPGLETMVKAATKSGHLLARTKPEPSDVFIIAVPTPIDENKHADLNAVSDASESIVPYLREGNLVILESTVPPGTSQEIVVPILGRSGLNAGTEFHVVHAPERVLPGQIMRELVENDRILGGSNQKAAERARELYNKFVSGNIYLTDSTTAELVKLVENTYRDVNIALANEIARISARLKTNVWEVIDLANKHPRVNVLQPGPGVGGHCIPVDPWFIVESVPEQARLIKLARITNDEMPAYISESIMVMLNGIDEPVVTVLGVAYKPNVDDDRESPSYKVITQLEESGCSVRVHDPYVLPQIFLEEVIQGSDCIAWLVDHQEYQDLDPKILTPIMRTKNLYIAKNLSSEQPWIEAGFTIKQLGKGLKTERVPESQARVSIHGTSNG